MRKRIMSGVSAIVCMLALITACAPKEASAPESVETVRIGVSNEVLSGLVQVAEAQGMFAARSVNVTITRYATGKEAVDGFLAGDVDMGTAADTPVVFASLSRPDLRIISTIGACDDEIAVVARPSTGIEKPEDLRGHTVRTLQKTGSHYFLHLFLARYGLTMDDVEFSSATFGETTKSFIEGDVDAMAIREPYVSEAKDALGGDTRVFTQPGLYRKTVMLFASDDTDPEAVSRILAALHDAEAWVAEHPGGAAQIISTSLDRSVSEVMSALEVSDLRLLVDQSLVLDLESQANWLLESKLTSATGVPDYLSLMRTAELREVTPESVTLIE